MCVWREFLFFLERNEMHNRQINAKCVKIDDYMSVYGIDTCILDLVDLTLCVDIIRKYSHTIVSSEYHSHVMLFAIVNIH